MEPDKGGELPVSGILIRSHHFPSKSNKSKSEYKRFPDPLKYRLWQVLHTKGRAILLLRHPADALLSYWKHSLTGDVHQQNVDYQDLEKILKVSVLNIIIVQC